MAKAAKKVLSFDEIITELRRRYEEAEELRDKAQQAAEDLKQVDELILAIKDMLKLK